MQSEHELMGIDTAARDLAPSEGGIQMHHVRLSCGKIRRTGRLAALLLALAALDAQAFYYEEGGVRWTYSVYDSSYAVIYNGGNVAIRPPGYAGSLTVPSQVDNGTVYPVRRLGSNALKGCSGIVSLTVPNGIESIGQAACSGCSGLRSVSLPPTLARIEAQAFMDCSSLASVVIPEGVTEVSALAFAGCTNLASVTLPSTLATVGTNAFERCIRLREIVFSTPAGTQVAIGNQAFKDCTALERVVLPDSVEFGFSGFYGSSDAYVTDAFSGCSAIRYVSLAHPLNVRQRAERTGQAVRFNCIFPNVYQSVTNVVIRGGELMANMFNGCSGLQGVDIAASVTNIGKYAFYECTSLRSMSIPDNVVGIGTSAFRGCSALESADLGNGLRSMASEMFYGCSSLADVALSSNLVQIGGSAFRGCSSLESVEMPSGVTSIGGSAFDGCSRLSGITLPDRLASIGDYAFRNCSAMTELVIPDSVTSVGYNCVKGASSLRRLVVGDGITGSLPYTTFEGLAAVEYVAIGDGVTAIGEYMFMKMNETTLRNVKLGSSVTSIGYYAFNNCKAIKTLVIPLSVTSIASIAFMGMQALETIYLPSRFRDYDRPGSFSPSVTVVYYDDESELPRETFTQSTPVPVPHAWLDEYPAELSRHGGNYELFGNAQAANPRYKVWECYVAGLCPTNADSRFTVFIEMRGDEPVITWHPDLNSNGVTREYTIWGKTNLLDGAWHTPTNSASRFFRVEVSMPQ
ncbi:MAG: leucine-rich repeat domain-containing protein [Kiritimatiellae bacterium]|nr:leucine-rich repeat domain-containing protein [Kiritimatiellia bacterium]